jgi:hypothetical protein
MNPETTPTNVTSEPTAQKRKLHIPFPKKNSTAPADANETARKSAPYGIYTAGLILVAAGVVAAVASKLKSSDDEVVEDSSDITDAA